ncbi:hypothetical protein L484_010191 [Morus notabilis]|uniref:Uncharacterized protein n=1 Tax=Morus notabilis TaxID=981085 RepID=W9QHS6_9ROSA|nr:hypothetical protein L484_010191 [Morus notabilis]
MESFKRSSTLVLLIVLVSFVVHEASAYYYKYCDAYSRCSGKTLICPSECPGTTSKHQKAKVCYIDCNKPVCKAECRRKFMP